MAWDWEWEWCHHSQEWRWRWIWRPDKEWRSWRDTAPTLQEHWDEGDGPSQAPQKDRGIGPHPAGQDRKGKNRPSAVRQDREMEAAYQKVAARRAQQRPDAPKLSRSSYVRNRSNPPKAVRQAQSGARDRAQSQPAEQAKAPPGVREPPPRPERHEQPKAAAGPNGEPSSTSRCSSSSSDSDTGKGTSPPAMDPAQDMTAWSRRQVRKTTAAKTRTQRPENTQDSEDYEQGEDASPKKGLKEEEGKCPPPEQAEAEPEPGPPTGNPETVRRFDISCRDGPSRVTIRVGFDVEAPASFAGSLSHPQPNARPQQHSRTGRHHPRAVRVGPRPDLGRGCCQYLPYQGVEAAPAAAAQAKQVQPGPRLASQLLTNSLPRQVFRMRLPSPKAWPRERMRFRLLAGLSCQTTASLASLAM